MAAGDVVVFNQFLEDVGLEIHNLNAADTIKVGLITSSTTPTASTAGPCWGAGGSTNLSTNEVSAGGNYSAGGEACAATYAESGGTVTFDLADVSIAQDASNPTNARWGIIYNDTAANKNCIAYVDLGADRDLTSGAFSITWDASGVFTIS